MFCWYYRWKISRLADDNLTILPRSLRRHQNHCPDCRIFYQTSMDLTARLQLEAVLQRKEMSQLLLSQILDSVNQADSDKQIATTWSSKTLWISSAAAVILVMIAMIIALRPTATSLETLPVSPEENLAIKNLERFIPSDAVIAQEISPRNLPEMWSQFLEKPLRQEVDGILRETTAAFNFVRSCSAISLPDNRTVPPEDK
ncbi:hypothetical protein ACFL02_04580 [Planctomycetota bacterium]